MCKSSKLVCLFLLTCLQYLSKSTADDTWGDVKNCALETIDSCHERCADLLDTSLRDGAKQCEEDLTLSLLEAEANCLRKNGFDVIDSTPCWTAEPASERRRRQSLSHVEGFHKYRKCFDLCANSGVSDKAPQRCQKNCKELTDPEQTEAVRICQDKTESAYKDLVKDRLNAAFKAVSCLTSLVLG